MAIIVFVAFAILVVLGAALVLVGRVDPGVTASGRAGPPALPDAPLTARDVSALRFRVGLRGYRMQDVDAALAAIAAGLPQDTDSGAVSDDDAPTTSSTD